jgi:hypothetical protein
MKQFEIGQHVMVDTLSGTQIEKIVYAVRPDAPLVCSIVEWALAKAEDREPLGTGWPKEHIHA